MVDKMCNVYCLSFNNEERKLNMAKRFATIGLECKFSEGVYFTDNRINNYDIPNEVKRVWSCMYGHLDMINEFYYNSDSNIGIFCEDDIYIHKDFKKNLKRICFDFKILNLDVLLLGYLVPFKIDINNQYFPMKNNVISNVGEYTYHNFLDNVWGTQMYMLSKEHAKYLLDKYDSQSGYAERTIHDSSLTPFSADWIITKQGNRALISPILVVEDNKCVYNEKNQESFHKACHKAHFHSELFIV